MNIKIIFVILSFILIQPKAIAMDEKYSDFELMACDALIELSSTPVLTKKGILNCVNTSYDRTINFIKEQVLDKGNIVATQKDLWIRFNQSNKSISESMFSKNLSIIRADKGTSVEVIEFINQCHRSKKLKKHK